MEWMSKWMWLNEGGGESQVKESELNHEGTVELLKGFKQRVTWSYLSFQVKWEWGLGRSGRVFSVRTAVGVSLLRMSLFCTYGQLCSCLLCLPLHQVVTKSAQYVYSLNPATPLGCHFFREAFPNFPTWKGTKSSPELSHPFKCYPLIALITFYFSTRFSGFKPQLYHLLALCLWTNPLVFLHLYFFIDKNGDNDNTFLWSSL